MKALKLKALMTNQLGTVYMAYSTDLIRKK